MGISNIFRNNKTSWLYFAVVFILPFVATSFIVRFVILEYQEYFASPTPLFLAGFYTLACLTMALALTHTTFVAVLSGFFFGWNTLLYVIGSYLVASIIGFGLARTIDRGKLMDSLLSLPKAPVIARGLKDKEMRVIILSRLSPALPFAITNLLLAFLQADFRKFVIGGFIGMLPRTLLFIWAGTQAKELTEVFRQPNRLSIVQIGTVAFLMISVFGLFYYIVGAIRKAGRPED